MADAMKLWATTHRELRTKPANALRVSLATIAIGLGAGLASPSNVLAQLNGGPMGNTGHSALEKQAPDKPAVAAPDAVPGAKAREPAAPATRSSGDMSPNEALFDSINRGDIAGARDALNRGAELESVNILGMTPMELSVDLGRNDISFLLLSMRGDDGLQGPPSVSRPPAAVGKAAKPAATAKAAVPAHSPVQSKPVVAPKLFANDGGSPLPAAGFLGFDTKKAAN
ncbi:MAG TPA: ankyrin repeat domain-containing protein [Acetobacteraceae bacterium]|jgi:hypothetical protein|nr:ankyrin repeat domain-containing protein [Acetobacteraceae bacterium]